MQICMYIYIYIYIYICWLKLGLAIQLGLAWLGLVIQCTLHRCHAAVESRLVVLVVLSSTLRSSCSGRSAALISGYRVHPPLNLIPALAESSAVAFTCTSCLARLDRLFIQRLSTLRATVSNEYHQSCGCRCRVYDSTTR